MRVLFIVEHYYPYIGGAEELWRSLAEYLVRRGDEVKIVTTKYRKNLEKRETINGVDIIRLNVINRFGFSIFSIPVCIKHAKWADVIHTSSYTAAVPARIAAYTSKTKCLITFHEVWGKLWFKLPFLNLPERLAYYLFEKMILNLKFDLFVAVSQYTLNCLRLAGVKDEKSICIYNGLDYSEFENIQLVEPQSFTFCYFGRPGVSKGLEIIIPAFIKISRDFPEIRLKLIISKSPDKIYRWVKKTISLAKIAEKVSFFHELERGELLKEVKASSAVLIGSHSEGFCFVAAEAVALRRPIVSSGKGALKEVVSGHFIEINDLELNSFYEAMKQAYLGQWQQTKIREFKISETVNNYRQLYNQLV